MKTILKLIICYQQTKKYYRKKKYRTIRYDSNQNGHATTNFDQKIEAKINSHNESTLEDGILFALDFQCINQFSNVDILSR